jgi:PAS domain S-box-containing protein
MVETMGEGAVSISNDGTILFSNKSFARLIRSQLEKIIGTNIAQYIDPENRSKFQSSLTRGSIPSRLEASILSRDGSKIPVYLSTSALGDEDSSGFSVVITDLTHQKKEEYLQAEVAERKRIERELRISEERFKNIVKDQSELICRFLPDGILTFVNQAFSNMAEMPENELLGNSFFMFLADEDVSRVVKLMNEVSPADPDRSIELKVYVKDKIYWMHWIGRGLFDSDGNLIEYQAVGRDVTDRKRTEEEIKRRTKELEWVNAELESFSYSVSHDLRAPLRAIDGFADILLEGIGDKLDPESMRVFKVIRSNTEFMTQLIDGLLKLSRVGRTNLSPSKIEMNSLVENIWEEIRAGNPGRSMELKTNHLPPASGDSVLVRQVLSNLLGNAVKFTKYHDHALIEVSGSVSGGFNTYCVKDNGTGFDMRYYDKLFGVFRRLHSESEFEGTGVGLAIVKKIIQRHGGNVWAEGKPGEGATFFFTLPA